MYRTVSSKVPTISGVPGHDADLLAADDLRWVSPRLDPLCLPPAWHCSGVSRYDAAIFHSYLGYAFHALHRCSIRGGRIATITSFHGLEPLYFRALAREAPRQGRPLSAATGWCTAR